MVTGGATAPHCTLTELSLHHPSVGGSGMGRVLCVKLARMGVHVAMCDLTEAIAAPSLLLRLVDSCVALLPQPLGASVAQQHGDCGLEVREQQRRL